MRDKVPSDMNAHVKLERIRHEPKLEMLFVNDKTRGISRFASSERSSNRARQKQDTVAFMGTSPSPNATWADTDDDHLVPLIGDPLILVVYRE
ncbi:MAG: hypothetical protein Q9181_002573 [Wetmoreana brouardii]